MTYRDLRDNTPDPPIRPIDWPRLMRIAEQRGFPVLRNATDGTQHVLHAVADLQGWPSQTPGDQRRPTEGSTR